MVEAVVGPRATGSEDIDREVKRLVDSGQSLYRLNEKAFLSAQPDVILTQDLCHVCAVTPDQLRRLIPSLPVSPKILTLNPTSLSEIVDDVVRIGTTLGMAARGHEFAQSLRQRIAAVQERIVTAQARPRILCLEWLSPLYIGGHWIPEMVDLAGGRNVLGQTKEPSREVRWDAIEATKVDIAIIMPCGFSVERTVAELKSLCQAGNQWSHALTTWPKTYVVDAGSYFSRPGPRLVDGLELLAAIFSESDLTQFDHSVVREITGTSSIMNSC